MCKHHFPHSCKNSNDLNIYFNGFLLFNTLESIATPCSVKAMGR